jgi:hypothetical protein
MVSLIVLAGLTSCASAVTINATREPALHGVLEPVAFVIFQGNTGPEYTYPLKRYLERELAERLISGEALLLSSAESNEQEVLKRLAPRFRGICLITPTGTTSNYGSLSQILYDVRVLEVTDAASGTAQVVWRARVDTKSGPFSSHIRGRLRDFAVELVDRLVSDGVLSHRAQRIAH